MERRAAVLKRQTVRVRVLGQRLWQRASGTDVVANASQQTLMLWAALPAEESRPRSDKSRDAMRRCVLRGEHKGRRGWCCCGAPSCCEVPVGAARGVETLWV